MTGCCCLGIRPAALEARGGNCWITDDAFFFLNARLDDPRRFGVEPLAGKIILAPLVAEALVAELKFTSSAALEPGSLMAYCCEVSLPTKSNYSWTKAYRRISLSWQILTPPLPYLSEMATLVKPLCKEFAESRCLELGLSIGLLAPSIRLFL